MKSSHHTRSYPESWSPKASSSTQLGGDASYSTSSETPLGHSRTRSPASPSTSDVLSSVPPRQALHLAAVLLRNDASFFRLPLFAKHGVDHVTYHLQRGSVPSVARQQSSHAASDVAPAPSGLLMQKRWFTNNRISLAESLDDTSCSDMFLCRTFLHCDYRVAAAELLDPLSPHFLLAPPSLDATHVSRTGSVVLLKEPMVGVPEPPARGGSRVVPLLSRSATRAFAAGGDSSQNRPSRFDQRPANLRVGATAENDARADDGEHLLLACKRLRKDRAVAAMLLYRCRTAIDKEKAVMVFGPGQKDATLKEEEKLELVRRKHDAERYFDSIVDGQESGFVVIVSDRSRTG